MIVPIESLMVQGAWTSGIANGDQLSMGVFPFVFSLLP